MTRKQMLCWTVLLLSTALLLVDKLAGSEWVNIITLTYAAYAAANVTDKKFGGAG